MRNPVGLCACITLLGAGSSALRLKLVNSSYDVDLLREVGFLRSRHEEATNLLTKSLKKRGGGSEDVQRAVRLLDANVRHWADVEGKLRLAVSSEKKEISRLYEDAVFLIAHNRAQLGQAYAGEGERLLALKELETACPILWELQRMRRAPHNHGEPASDRWLQCYAVLADLCLLKVPGSEPSLIDGEVLSRLPWLSNLPGIMGREEGVALSERALKLQTLAMISKLSALSKEEKLQVERETKMVWSEAETLRSNLNDVTQQFVVTYTAEQQQACLDRAQGFIRASEGRLSRLLSWGPSQPTGGSNPTQIKPASGSGGHALGTSSFASFLSLGPVKGITALLFEEMIREGKHYISIMKGIRMHGWAFLEAESKRLNEYMARLEGNTIGAGGAMQGSQSRSDVLGMFRFYRTQALAQARRAHEPSKPARRQEERRAKASGGVHKAVDEDRAWVWVASCLFIIFVGVLSLTSSFRFGRARARQRAATRAAARQRTHGEPKDSGIFWMLELRESYREYKLEARLAVRDLVNRILKAKDKWLRFWRGLSLRLTLWINGGRDRDDFLVEEELVRAVFGSKQGGVTKKASDGAVKHQKKEGGEEKVSAASAERTISPLQQENVMEEMKDASEVFMAAKVGGGEQKKKSGGRVKKSRRTSPTATTVQTQDATPQPVPVEPPRAISEEVVVIRSDSEGEEGESSFMIVDLVKKENLGKRDEIKCREEIKGKIEETDRRGDEGPIEHLIEARSVPVEETLQSNPQVPEDGQKGTAEDVKGGRIQEGEVEEKGEMTGRGPASKVELKPIMITAFPSRPPLASPYYVGGSSPPAHPVDGLNRSPRSPYVMLGDGFFPAMMARTPSPALFASLSREELLGALKRQIEYYFSVENLCKDMYLRSKMDQEGFVFLGEISKFNRIRCMTVDVRMIMASVKQSSLLELKLPWSIRAMSLEVIDDCNTPTLLACQIRTKDHPERWVIPGAGAQT